MPTERASAIRAGRVKLATYAAWTRLAEDTRAMQAAVGRRRARGTAAAWRVGAVSAGRGTEGTGAIGACRATTGMIARFNVTRMTLAMGVGGAMRTACVSARMALLGTSAPSAPTADQMLTVARYAIVRRNALIMGDVPEKARAYA